MPKLKKKEWTEHQKTRIPDDGYWLSFFTGDGGYTSTHAYCVMNGMVKYIREDDFRGKKSCAMPDWYTLQWNCMPTRKKIMAPDPRVVYFHFETHEEMIKTFPTLPKTFFNKAPNDF